MRKWLLALSFLGWLFVSGCSDASSNALPSPSSQFFVLDDANILSDQTEQSIITKGQTIESINEQPQLVLVTTDDLKGRSIEEYSTELVSEWGIGSENLDNGVLLLYNNDTNNYRIEVGYGLEGAITDGKAGAILDDAIAIKETDGIEKALTQAYDNLALEIQAEYEVISETELKSQQTITYDQDASDEDLGPLLWIIILLLALQGLHTLVSYLVYKVTGFEGWLLFNLAFFEIFIRIIAIAASSGGSSSSSGGSRGGGGSSGGGGASR